MLFRMVVRSLRHGAGASAGAVAQLAASALLAALFVNVALDVEDKMARELRTSGANALLLPRAAEAPFPPGAGEAARGTGATLAVLSAGVGLIADEPVLVVEAEPAELSAMTPYWEVAGNRAPGPGECLLGRRAAERAKAATGGELRVTWPDGRRLDLRVVGTFESGDEDEARVWIARPALGSFLPERGRSSFALARVAGDPEAFRALADALGPHGVGVEPIRQVVATERKVLDKVSILTLFTLVAVLVLTVLGVSAAGLARIVERRREISLLQSLGASRRSVLALLLAESGATGAFAGLLGWVAGSAAAYAVTLHVFRVPAAPRFAALVAALAVAGVASLLAALAGASRALRLEPAAILRGE